MRAARGIPTAPWAIYRRGAPVEQARCPAGERLVIKPNASSASWGVQDARDWAGVEAAVAGSTPKAMTRSSSPSSTAATSRCR
jgi:D-alanine-D-alanine ligase